MGPPEFHRLADRELNEAAQYYDLESSPPPTISLRTSLSVKPDSIRILAIMNLKRRPTYWVGRE